MIIYSVFISCIIILLFSTFINDFAFGFFHQQDKQNNNNIELDEDIKIIHEISDEVNLNSFKFQTILKDFESNFINNDQMINETEKYIVNLEDIVNKSKSYKLDKKYQQILSKYIISLEYEVESYKHFKIYLSTGNITENEISIQLLSSALKNELEAISLFKKVVEGTIN
ncbi:MAG: hypothetical protein ACPKPY_09085 [Nitrososphaeraceae archaeon]